MKNDTIVRLRVTCLSGPWLDDTCVRYIDVPAHANLYDLHVAIQDAVNFDEEFPFHFFTALTPEGGRTMIPADLPADADPADIDPDVYEDQAVLNHVKANAKRALFYVFGSEFDDWIFKIQHTGESHEAVPGAFYPLVRDEQSEGPDPEQYGSGFDDFAESDDAFRPKPRLSAGIDHDPDADPGGDEAEDAFLGLLDDDAEEEDDDAFFFDSDEDDDDDIW